MEECDCGWCGRCQEQHEHDVYRRSPSSYDDHYNKTEEPSHDNR